MYDLTDTYLGQYHITEIISYGGTSTVYKAYQASLDRYVAVKVLLYNRDPQFASRFKREARLIAQLQHPNIMPIYEYGEHEAMLYLVLRYIEQGATLDHMLGTPMEPIQALRLTSKLLSALDYAHARGIIHRDVKPANVLMPAPDWPLLADFGIAKFTQDDLRLTSTGLIIGTAAYMSPEQATGEPLDARSDVYATGVLLYEMLTGQVPFDGSSAMALLHKHVHAPPPAPRSLVPNLPEVVESALLRALAKAPDERYQSAAEMSEELEQIAARLEQGAVLDAAVVPIQPVSAPTMPDRAPAVLPGDAQRTQRSAWRSWSTFLIAAALIGGGSGLGYIGVRSAGAQLPEPTTSAALVSASAIAILPTQSVLPTNTPTDTPLPTDTPAPTNVPAPTEDIAAAKAETATARAEERAARLDARATATANSAATATVVAQVAADAQATTEAQAAAARRATTQAQAAKATAAAPKPKPKPTAVPPPVIVPPQPPLPTATFVPPTAVPPTAVPPAPEPPTPEPPTPEPTKKRGGGGGGGGGGEPEPPPPGKD